MSDRVSISFKGEQSASVVLHSHWAGMWLVWEAQQFAEEKRDKLPGMVMSDFIVHLNSMHKPYYAQGTYRLDFTPLDEKFSDQGHHVIVLGEPYIFSQREHVSEACPCNRSEALSSAVEQVASE